MPRKKARGSLAANLLLSACSAILFTAVLEGGARWLNLPPGNFLLFTPKYCLELHGSLVYQARPHCTGTDKHGQWSTNSLGMRNGEVRDDGSRRILAIGDSCTWGWGAPHDESYSAILQRLLDERSGVGAFQVLTAAAPGWSSYQGRVYLHESGIALHPAIVLFALGYNDPMQIGDEEERAAGMRKFSPLLGFDRYLLDRSVLYAWWRSQLQQRVQNPDLRPRVSPEKYRANLIDSVTLARENGAKIMFVRFAPPRSDQDSHIAVLNSVSSELNVPVVVYEGRRVDLVHPTVAGYHMIAGQIADALAANGFLDPQPAVAQQN